MSTNTNDPINPVSQDQIKNSEAINVFGLTKLEFMSTECLKALLSNPEITSHFQYEDDFYTEIAKHSIRHAEALIYELKKKW